MARATLLVEDPATFPLAGAPRVDHNALNDIPAFFGFRKLTVVVRA